MGRFSDEDGKSREGSKNVTLRIPIVGGARGYVDEGRREAGRKEGAHFHI